MKILIKVTKAVLVKSAMCGYRNDLMGIASNCALAVAVRDLFPNAKIGNPDYSLTGLDEDDAKLPYEARVFINRFDLSSPDQRINMPEISFEIEVPSSVIDRIGIQEAYRILSESKTLELVHP